MPVPGNQGGRAAEIQQYAAELNNQFPPGPDAQGKVVNFGQDYINYMDSHPNADPELVYETVVARISLLLSIPSTIGKAVAAGAGATGAIGGAGAAATSSLYPTWLQGFLGANGVLRIAEGAIGIVIAAVALDKLLGSSAPAPVTTIAKVFK